MNNEVKTELMDVELEAISGGRKYTFYYQEAMDQYGAIGYNVQRVSNTDCLGVGDPVFVEKEEWEDFKAENKAFGAFRKGSIVRS